MVTNILIAGVGGQGNILSSKIIAEAAMLENIPCIVGEVYGVSQRGGSVASHVRIGEGALSPISPECGANIICGFEPLEALRAAVTYSNPGSVILVNTRTTPPIAVNLKKAEYPSPERILAALRECSENVIEIDASGLAEGLGGLIYTNMVFLGAISVVGNLGIGVKSYEEAISRAVPKAAEFNRRAFRLGRKECQSLLQTRERKEVLR